MKVTAIISEYNPFHNGHLYHLNKAKELTNADYTISVMSGNFLQRGCPALLDKFTRAKISSLCGVDVVFELPAIYATASAEYFATGAILTIAKLGIVDSVCFGAECEDVSLLTQIAYILIGESEEFLISLKNELTKGTSFPKARAIAVSKITNSDMDILNVMEQPNNILAIEYIKAIIKYNLSLKPVVIKRHVAMYHDVDLNNSISSATAIREELFKSNTIENICNDVPNKTYTELLNKYNLTFPMDSNDFTQFLQHALLTNNNLSMYTDISGDLSDRILNSYNIDLNFTDLTEAVKSKQYTLTRIQRSLLHIVLNHQSQLLNNFINDEYVYYARLLSFNSNSSIVIKQIKEHSNIPVINKITNVYKSLSDNGKAMLDFDITCSNIYNQAVYNKFGQIINNDYTHNIEII